LYSLIEGFVKFEGHSRQSRRISVYAEKPVYDQPAEIAD